MINGKCPNKNNFIKYTINMIWQQHEKKLNVKFMRWTDKCVHGEKIWKYITFTTFA